MGTMNGARAVVVCAMIVAACGPAVQGAAVQGDVSTRTRGSRSSNILAAEEIRLSQHTDVFEMIQNLRPSWLAPRGQGSFSVADLDIFLDNAEMQGMDALKTITPSQIERAEYLSASEATLRMGTQRGSGAILLTSRRGRR